MFWFRAFHIERWTPVGPVDVVWNGHNIATIFELAMIGQLAPKGGDLRKVNVVHGLVRNMFASEDYIAMPVATLRSCRPFVSDESGKGARRGGFIRCKLRASPLASACSSAIDTGFRAH